MPEMEKVDDRCLEEEVQYLIEKCMPWIQQQGRLQLSGNGGT